MRCPECGVHHTNGHLLGCSIAAAYAFDELAARSAETIEMAAVIVRAHDIPQLERAEELGRLAGLLKQRSQAMVEIAATVSAAA